tara:strand:- start:5878 stop:7008 length:1131 start_codon:yes stop_codon:yes gene_type:complete
MNKIKIYILLFLATSLLAIPNPPDLGVGSYILYEPNTKKILVSYNSDEPVEPASLTKLMTSYVVADYLKEDFINITDEPKISVKAWKTKGSRMFIREGTNVRVSDLIKGMIIQSGNDASVALAEHVAGSEDNFAYLMNEYASELGMANTSFNNATGLPDPLNVTSAYDLALLTSALINDFPEHYKYYSQKSFTYNGIKQSNRNRLLWRDEIFDGVKTGYTQSAGYCLVGSAIRGDMRLVAVVLGSEDDKRFNDVSLLMTYGFRYFTTEKLFSKEEPIQDVKVVAGKSETVKVGTKDDIILTLQKDLRDNIRYEVSVGSQTLAPIEAMTTAGTLKVLDSENNVLVETEIVFLESVEELGFFQRLLAIIWNWIQSLFN